MKVNTVYLSLFLVFTVLVGCAVAIDYDVLNPKYWSGILITLLWATIGITLLKFLSEEK
jgi:hypothetical protein